MRGFFLYTGFKISKSLSLSWQSFQTLFFFKFKQEFEIAAISAHEPLLFASLQSFILLISSLPLPQSEQKFENEKSAAATGPQLSRSWSRHLCPHEKTDPSAPLLMAGTLFISPANLSPFFFQE